MRFGACDVRLLFLAAINYGDGHCADEVAVEVGDSFTRDVASLEERVIVDRNDDWRPYD